MHYHAKTVHDCWLIARRATEAYQRRMRRNVHRPGFKRQAVTLGMTARQLEFELCKAARDACDRIALTIRFGNKRGRR